jgi:hypothetical protein
MAESDSNREHAGTPLCRQSRGEPVTPTPEQSVDPEPVENTEPPSTPEVTDPYARRRDDWPPVITDPDYAVPTPDHRPGR